MAHDRTWIHACVYAGAHVRHVSLRTNQWSTRRGIHIARHNQGIAAVGTKVIARHNLIGGTNCPFVEITSHTMTKFPCRVAKRGGHNIAGIGIDSRDWDTRGTSQGELR